MTEIKRNDGGAEVKRPWTAPKIKAVGAIGEILRNGTAKVSILTGDPGEALKNTHMG